MESVAGAAHHDPVRPPSANARAIVTPPPQNTLTNLRQSHQLTCVVATKDALSDRMDMGGTDSGYATAESTSSTPEGKESEKREGSIANHILEFPGRKLFPRKVIRLREFDNTIPKVLHDRFADLCELLGKPLCERLAKAKLKYKALGMKLKTLGESKESAQPWIVVLCDPTIIKRVKRFFQEQWVKDACQGLNADLNLPHLKTHFFIQAPQQRAGFVHLDVHNNPISTISNAETLCGRAVMISHPNGFRAATLGGRIMVADAYGGLQDYALTAGHVSSAIDSLGDNSEMNSFDDNDALNEHYGQDDIDSDSELFELGLDYEVVIDFQEDSGFHMHVPEIVPQSVGRDQSSPELWPKLGHIYSTSYSADSNAANLDWALVTIDHPSDHLPNKLIESSTLRWQLTSVSVTPLQELPSSRSVVVMTGPACDGRRGYLSNNTSSVLLAPGTEFIRVYDLKFSNGSRKFYPEKP